MLLLLHDSAIHGARVALNAHNVPWAVPIVLRNGVGHAQHGELVPLNSPLPLPVFAAVIAYVHACNNSSMDSHLGAKMK